MSQPQPNDDTGKVLSYDTAAATLAKLKADGKTLVQCHGAFDLIHPGHIYHLEEAKALGDILVVTVTAEKYVNKGPGRPYFNDALRAKSLAALSFVDYVVMIPFPAAVEAIEVVKPNLYCKGREYEDQENDVMGNIQDDVATVEKHGGEIAYVGSIVFSSTRLLNKHFDALPPTVKQFCKGMANRCTPDQLKEYVDAFKGLKVLVMGDIIFDRYSYVRVQGLTSKNRIISGRYLNENTQAGGALAVYRHVKQFTNTVDLFSIAGTEPWVEQTLASYIDNDDNRVIRDREFTTIIKQRFVESPKDGKELSKLFSVNYIDNDPPSAEAVRKIEKHLREIIRDYDVVIVADFGHGLMQSTIRETVQTEARFLALNCQTNSNNHGFNIISNQYTRADCFSLDLQEMLLACATKDLDYTVELEKLRRKLSAKYTWLTRGDVETIALKDGKDECICPPLETTVTDTIGAGDAFFSVAALSAALEQPLEITLFLGQLAGAQAVRIIGNEEPISRQHMLKSGMGLLNF